MTKKAAVRRRRRALLLAVLALAGVATFVALDPLKKAVDEITLPLRHEDIIRQQARDKSLDPALVAAVIYQESKFVDQTSHAGARGLMQITPDTADFIARRSGGVRFEQADLATPQINISYGCWYLRYLLQRYEGRTPLAVAAYNAGMGHVDKWIERAGGQDDFNPRADIPFPETKHYVLNVMKRRTDYARKYSRELGL